MLTGSNPAPEGRLPKVQRLTPYLEPGEELQAYAVFRDLETYTQTKK
jgi:hypothetical protein